VVWQVIPRKLVGLTVEIRVSTKIACIGLWMGRATYFPMARIAWTVMFMIIIPLARRWKGRTSRA
jgi:hypothetical protein